MKTNFSDRNSHGLIYFQEADTNRDLFNPSQNNCRHAWKTVLRGKGKSFLKLMLQDFTCITCIMIFRMISLNFL